MKFWFATFVMALAAAPAMSQQWPVKPVHLVVPFPPGGNVDAAARIVAERLQA